MTNISESITSFIHTSHKAYHEAQLYVQRGQINFLQKNKRKIDIFSPGITDVRLGHS